MLSKRLRTINLLSKAILLILRYRLLLDQLLKHSNDSDNQNLEKKAEDVDKKIRNVSGLVK